MGHVRVHACDPEGLRRLDLAVDRRTGRRDVREREMLRPDLLFRSELEDVARTVRSPSRSEHVLLRRRIRRRKSDRGGVIGELRECQRRKNVESVGRIYGVRRDG